MPNTLLELAVPCPWCGQGETLADNKADIRISCQCNVCRNYYKIDFKVLRAIRTKPKPRKDKTKAAQPLASQN